MEPVIGYCVKCKERREIKDPQEVAMPAKGEKTRPAMKGVCPVCATGIFKIMPSSWKAAAAPTPEPPQDAPRSVRSKNRRMSRRFSFSVAAALRLPRLAFLSLHSFFPLSEA